MKNSVLLIACLSGGWMPLYGVWSQVFHKKIAQDEAKRASEQHVFYFSRHDISPFTQLLVSWNALRPQRGHFTFYTQVRNARTKKWGAWHRMFDWGSTVQRSHESRSDGFSKYFHVRLELDPLHQADAFRIKVEALDGADLQLLKCIGVTAVHMREFVPERDLRTFKALCSVYIPGVDKVSQRSLVHKDNHRMCSPVSCSVLSSFLSKREINPLAFAGLSYDSGLNSYGSWPFNMAHSFEYTKGKVWFFHTRLSSFKELHRQLCRGIPVVVSVRGMLENAPQPYPHGHLLTVIGYDARLQRVICHDSAKEGHANVEQSYDLKGFLHAWEASRRLTYWAEWAK